MNKTSYVMAALLAAGCAGNRAQGPAPAPIATHQGQENFESWRAFNPHPQFGEGGVFKGGYNLKEHGVRDPANIGKYTDAAAHMDRSNDFTSGLHHDMNLYTKENLDDAREAIITNQKAELELLKEGHKMRMEQLRTEADAQYKAVTDSLNNAGKVGADAARKAAAEGVGKQKKQ